MDLEFWKIRKKELKLTFDGLSRKSCIPKRTLEDIFSGRTPNPRNDTVEAIEKALGINKKLPFGILDEDEAIKFIGGFDIIGTEKQLIPLVGRVVAGLPIASPEYLEGYVYVNYQNPEEYFALKVTGDSMIGAGITEKSILIIHKQNYAECGDIIVAAIDGESTVKRYKESKGIIFLMPENPTYTPIPVTEQNNFYIFGKVVQIRTEV